MTWHVRDPKYHREYMRKWRARFRKEHPELQKEIDRIGNLRAKFRKSGLKFPGGEISTKGEAFIRCEMRTEEQNRPRPETQEVA